MLNVYVINALSHDYICISRNHEKSINAHTLCTFAHTLCTFDTVPTDCEQGINGLQINKNDDTKDDLHKLLLTWLYTRKQRHID